tara:strand:- start:147 stop:263 length:117 start_codon:yes stop_codon:yes gene_type:complete
MKMETDSPDCLEQEQFRRDYAFKTFSAEKDVEKLNTDV